MPNVIYLWLYLVLILVFSVFILCMFFCNSNIIIFEAFYFNLNGSNFYIILDYCSYIVLLMLFICGFMVIPFIFHYAGSFNLGWNLFVLVALFIFVMVIMTVTGNLLFSLILWEYLGLVSYLLILFLCNYSSVRSALITLTASRFGDVAMFVLFGLGLFYCDSFRVYGFLLGLIIFTKSASFPFVSWLLEAMRAPTPVSCLVHSSTLVAAGVWFGLRYSFIISDFINEIIFMISIYTIALSAFSGLFFLDLKKLVALSTCNNISWCLLCLSLGDLNTCLLFLFTHGLCKCMLFIFIGDLMSSSGSSQSGLGVFLIRYSGVRGCSILSILVCSLCGMPYLGVFLSKHVLIDLSCITSNILVYIFCCVGVCLSFSYSYRFVFLILGSVKGICFGLRQGFIVYIILLFVPSLLSIFFYGSWLHMDLYYIYFSFNYLFLILHCVGFILGLVSYILSMPNASRWFYSLGGCDYIVGLFYSLVCLSERSFYFIFYRWEAGIFENIFYFVSIYSRCFFNVFGLNLIVLGLIWSFSFYFILL